MIVTLIYSIKSNLYFLICNVRFVFMSTGIPVRFVNLDGVVQQSYSKLISVRMPGEAPQSAVRPENNTEIRHEPTLERFSPRTKNSVNVEKKS